MTFFWPRHFGLERRKLVEAELGERLRWNHLYFCSSGSTGALKIFEHSRETLDASARAVVQHFGLQTRDVFFRVLPREHIGGYQVANRARLLGARLVEMDTWDPTLSLDTVGEEHVSVVSVVPTQLFDWVNLGRECPASLRVCLVGGSSLDPSLKARALKLGFPVFESLGLSEMGSTVAVRRAGSDFFEWLPQVEAQLKGEELWLRGPMKCLSVWKKDNVWAQASYGVQDWVPTGDRVQLQAGGCLWLGRVDQELKILGLKVDLASVEAKWMEHFGSQIRVFAKLDERRGHRLVVVTEKSSVDLAQIREFNSSLTGPERASLWFEVSWAEVTTELGKLSFDAILNRYTPHDLETK